MCFVGLLYLRLRLFGLVFDGFYVGYFGFGIAVLLVWVVNAACWFVLMFGWCLLGLVCCVWVEC